MTPTCQHNIHGHRIILLWSGLNLNTTPSLSHMQYQMWVHIAYKHLWIVHIINHFYSRKVTMLAYLPLILHWVKHATNSNTNLSIILVKSMSLYLNLKYQLILTDHIHEKLVDKKTRKTHQHNQVLKETYNN
jgi:hypothetical protein